MNKYLSFTKMHGLGNDFVVIDAVKNSISLSTRLICKIADRRFGVGCDQVLILEAPTPKYKNVDFVYHIFNADGSKATQCGNGVRCLAKFVVERGLSKKRNLVFATNSCLTKACLEKNGKVTVILDKPIFEPKNIPLVAKKQALRYNIPIGDCGEIEVGAVSVGNPHAVIFIEENFANYVVTLGPMISRSKCFPEGVNVNFMHVLDSKKIELWAYERGSGETLACGSGACAAVVVGRLWGFLESKVTVKLLGGDLLVQWDGLDSDIKMTGSGEQVFTGEINLAR